MILLLTALLACDVPRPGRVFTTFPSETPVGSSSSTGTPTLATDCDLVPWYADSDGDGFGDDATLIYACEDPGDAVGTGGDCDDADPTRHPTAPEACDGIDSDCGGDADHDAITLVGGGSFASLAEAVAAAVAGDVVEVCPGTYPAGVIATVDLVVEGTGARDEVILQGSSGSSVISVDGAALTLRHLTVAGGGDADISGGGVGAADATALTLEDCVVSGNTGSLGGGVRGPDNGSLTLIGGAVTGNVAAAGGGVYLGGAATLSATGVDFGSDAADNLPDDVATAFGGGFSGYGAGTDLTCDSLGCAR